VCHLSTDIDNLSFLVVTSNSQAKKIENHRAGDELSHSLPANYFIGRCRIVL